MINSARELLLHSRVIESEESDNEVYMTRILLSKVFIR